MDQYTLSIVSWYCKWCGVLNCLPVTITIECLMTTIIFKCQCAGPWNLKAVSGKNKLRDNHALNLSIPVTSTVYWCMASNLKALRNVFLNEKIHLCVGVSVSDICTIFMYKRGFIIVQLFRPWRRHNGLQNLICVLHCMVNSNSYVWIPVKIINF